MVSGFSTRDVAPQERVEFWREMVRRHFVPLSVQPRGAGRFEGEVRLRSVAALDLARVRADAMAVARGSRHIERSGGNEYFLGLQLKGVAVADQDGRRARLSPGDVALFDSARPYRIEFGAGARFDHLIVRVPRELLDCRASRLERATARRLASDSDPGRMASFALAALAGAGDGALFVDPVLDVIARALGEGAGIVPPPRTHAEHALADVKRMTLARLGDPELTPGIVAGACAMSVRQLHRLFAREATTFGTFVRETRLRRCRDELADASLGAFTIGEIARRHGFRSAPVFTRAFTAHYGVGPRAYRADATRG